MAGQSRTLKLSILADVDQLKKSLDTGSNEVQGFGGKLDGFAGKAKLAFAAAGAAAAAYAGKLLIDGVKAAAEDEAAQVRLANALKNTVGATDAAIASAETWITKQSLASGISDDQLRPALERLTRSTKDIEEAQKLTNLAMDIAKAKNLDLETVANALAKANDGQTGALKKLGITLGDNATNLQEYTKLQKALAKTQDEANFALEQYGPKSQEYEKALAKVAETQEKVNFVAQSGIDVFGELGKEFAGAAAESATTFEGKMAILKVSLDEAKESIGAALLPALTDLVTYIVENVLPIFQGFIAGLTGDEGTKKALDDTAQSGVAFGEKVRFLMDIIIKFKKEILILAGVMATVFVAGKIGAFVSSMVAGIRVIVGAMNALRTSSILAGIAAYFALNPLLGVGIGAATIAAIAAFAALSRQSDVEVEARAAGGPVAMGKKYLVGEKGPELFVPNSNGSIVPNNRMGGTTVNINVTGAVDPIGVARQIANILNTEATLSGTFNNLGISRLVAQT
jgi:hypothetical protein